MPDAVIYHIDANFLLNYLIPDNKDVHEEIRNRFERRNWYNDVYRISKYALGESLKRVLNFEYNTSITWENVTNRMSYIRGLISKKRLDIFDLEDVDNRWKQHYEELMEIQDSLVQKADRFILAFFCADPDAKRFYTMDSHIIKSKRINDYVSHLGKRISEV